MENLPAKTLEEAASISEMTRSNYLFASLGNQRLTQLVRVMQRERFSSGDVLMRMGEEGDKFYLVESGKYEVQVIDSDDRWRAVHSYENRGDSFGELSLMYGKPRAATIECTSDTGDCWSLSRLAFRAIVMKPMSNAASIRTLLKVDGLKELSLPQLQRVCDAASTEMHAQGDYIITQGEIGDSFYIITEGECLCTKTPDACDMDAEIELIRLGPSQYFGERALLHDEPRGANVKVVSLSVTVLKVTQRVFVEVSSQVAPDMDAEHRRRLSLEAARNAPQHATIFTQRRRSGVNHEPHLYGTVLRCVPLFDHLWNGQSDRRQS